MHTGDTTTKKRRGFSLPELIAVLFAMAVLSLGAVAMYNTIRGKSKDARAETALISAGGIQQSYHLSRGQWASGSALSGITKSGSTLTTGSSTGADVVSIAIVDVSGEDWLGLAVLVDEGRCMTLLVAPPEQASQEAPEVRELGAGDSCSGDSAA